MSPDHALALLAGLLKTTMIVTGPLLAAALLGGLFVGVMQTATQINEQSIGYVLKTAVVLVVMRPTWLRVAADGPVHGTIAAASTVTGTITVALGNGPGLDEVEVATGGRVYRRGEEVSLRIEEVILFEPRTGGRLA